MLALSGLLPAGTSLGSREGFLASPAVDGSAVWGTLRVVETRAELAVAAGSTVATISIAVVSEATCWGSGGLGTAPLSGSAILTDLTLTSYCQRTRCNVAQFHGESYCTSRLLLFSIPVAQLRGTTYEAQQR